MLVLSRQPEETIKIGDDIDVTVLEIRGNKVRLGFTAPASIEIHRLEIWQRIQRQLRDREIQGKDDAA